MNERIKELAMQVPRIKDMYEVGPVQRASIEEFADLIVQECFTKLTPYMDDQFIDDIETELREHFGVHNG